MLTLLKPPDPQAARANRFPVTGDVSAPITNAVAFSGTLAQNASVIQGVQTAINAQVGAAVPPTPSPLPSVPCATCGTFQSANAPSFSLPKGSAHLLLPNKSLGSDDSPFALAAFGDLRAGGTLQYGNGASTIGVLQTQIVDAVTRLSSSDSAIGYQSQRGQATFSGLALFANHQQPPAAPLAPGAPAIPPGNVTIPHLATYAFALVNDHVSSTLGCGATISGDLRDRRDCGTGRAAPAAVLSDVTEFARAAYDVTDGAINGFGGFQDKRTVIGGAGQQFSRTLMLGYRATGRNYQEIDGTQIALPTVSGPVASIRAFDPAPEPHHADLRSRRFGAPILFTTGPSPVAGREADVQLLGLRRRVLRDPRHTAHGAARGGEQAGWPARRRALSRRGEPASLAVVLVVELARPNRGHQSLRHDEAGLATDVHLPVRGRPSGTGLQLQSGRGFGGPGSDPDRHRLPARPGDDVVHARRQHRREQRHARRWSCRRISAKRAAPAHSRNASTTSSSVTSSIRATASS